MSGRPFHSPGSWPTGGREEWINRGRSRWTERIDSLPPEHRTFAQSLPSTDGGRALLECIFGFSPFLTDCAIRDPGMVQAFWNHGPRHCVEQALVNVRDLPVDCPDPSLLRTVRIARRRIAFATALADISGAWNLERVTEALTRLVEEACSAALRVLLTRLATRGKMVLPDPSQPEADSGLIVLGLGKLGGRELNFSSDIDLILLYDPEVVPFRRPYEAPMHMLRLGRWLVRLLSEPTADGTAFRVDLRLRPDPVSTPLIPSTKAALRYYDTRGQTWERAAMIKARPIAGDRAAAGAYLRRLSRFVWRERLDFATIQDLHEIKNRIDAQHRGGDIGTPGQNIKLGRGGIREIEFFTQAHQLVWAGEKSPLRVVPTCEALQALTRAGKVTRSATEALVSSYRYLRTVEHRLQMVDDKQTHSLPTAARDLEMLARFLGYPGQKAFREDLIEHLRRVELQYEDYFELPRELLDAGSSSVLESQDRRENVERLRQMGFRDPDRAFRISSQWLSGTTTVDPAGSPHELLHLLAPSIVIATCGTEDPDLALRRFDRLLAAVPDLEATLSLLQANLHVMESVADVLVSTPTLSAMLLERPDLLETLLDPGTDAWTADRSAAENDLREWMSRVEAGEDPFERLRSWLEAARFRIGIQLVAGSLGPLEAAGFLSVVVDCGVTLALRLSMKNLAATAGRVPEATVAVVAFARMARHEVGFGRFLDLAVCYDAPADSCSGGTLPLPAAEYFARLEEGVVEGLAGPGRSAQTYRCRVPAGCSQLADLVRGIAERAPVRAELRSPRVVAETGHDAGKVSRAVSEALSTAFTPDGLRAAQLSLSQANRTTGPSGSTATSIGEGLAGLEMLADYAATVSGGRQPVDRTLPTGPMLQSLGSTSPLGSQQTASLVRAWYLLARLRVLGELLDPFEPGIRGSRSRRLVESVAGVDSVESLPATVSAIHSEVASACESHLSGGRAG